MSGVRSHVLTAVRIVAMLGLLVVTGTMLVATVPALFGTESFVVSVTNMQPALAVDDLAFVKPTAVEEIAPRDIIVYRLPQDPATVLTRRMLYSEADERGGQKLQVRGDSEPSAEQVTVQRGSQLGRLQLSVPRVGVLVSFGNSMAGRALLLGLPLVLLIVDHARKRLAKDSAAAVVGPPIDLARLDALLDTGQRALAAGYPELAMRAADGALALDHTNAAAALLKRVAQSALDSRRAADVA
jgi:signal peptidase I